MDIISGEKIQEVCDIYLGYQEDFTFNPYINTHQNKCLYIEQVPIKWNNPYLIFVYSHRLTVFISIMSRIINKFILVSHNSDENITEKYRPILDHPKLIFWHSQNVLINHPNLGCLPIGIANRMWGFRNIEIMNQVILMNIIKINYVYFYFNVNTNKNERQECKEKLENKGLPFGRNESRYESYLKNLSSHKYAICPPGNGIDCHRTWECLYLGVIPIFKRSVFTEKLSKKFTCIILNDWSDFNKEILDSQYPGAMYYNTLNLGDIKINKPNDYFLL